MSRSSATLDVDRDADLTFRVSDRMQRAVAELDKNGVPWREPVNEADCPDESPHLPGRRRSPPVALNVVDQGREDFKSAPDAVEMSPDDIANVEILSAIEAREVLGGIASRLGLEVVESDPLAPEAQWGDGWPADDQRWTLTPHALRKLRPVKAAKCRATA